MTTPAVPTVHLVGAGPGNPMLLTRKAARLLAAADVVVLDRRSLDGIAALAPPAAERIFVGRTDGHPAWTTSAIADLLADRARAHNGAPIVVRLKSGDPFVCSRGGEEMAALVARGVHVDVTPGVSAATAAPLAAVMPHGRSVTVLAGNHDPVYPDTDLAALADPDASIVVLVGRSRQGAIATALLAAGLDPATPAAIVHAATRPDAQVVHTTLDRLGDHRLPPPATVVIGPARAHP
ncbi:MAG: uroporphyrin-III C-methyltransferase [Actinomycetota bacterium]|nr:uroporphyrin-III C-methyltransferase [Actinomycetota bacterium]